MPKSVNSIEGEDVEKQTVNSAADEPDEFEVERILAYEPNKFISEKTKKVCGYSVTSLNDPCVWLGSLWERNPSSEPAAPFKGLFVCRREFVYTLSLLWELSPHVEYAHSAVRTRMVYYDYVVPIPHSCVHR